MPVGKLYLPPPPAKKVGELRSPFLDREQKAQQGGGTVVKRNFVLPPKKGSSASPSPSPAAGRRSNGIGAEKKSPSPLRNGNGLKGAEDKSAEEKEKEEEPKQNGIGPHENGEEIRPAGPLGTPKEEPPPPPAKPEVKEDEEDGDSEKVIAPPPPADNGVEEEEEGEEEEEEEYEEEEEEEDEEVKDKTAAGNKAPEEDEGGGIVKGDDESNEAVNGNEPDEEEEDANEGEKEDEEQPLTNGLNGHHQEPDPEPDPDPAVPAQVTPAPVSVPDRAKGLKNLGNTCFMNSIIQCLAHAAPILQFCHGFDPRRCKEERQKEPGGNSSSSNNKSSSKKTSPAITQAFSNLVKDMWSSSSSSSSYSSDRSPGDPSAFKREMGAFESRFQGFEQHDSQEFLQYALEGVHGEVCTGREVKKVVPRDRNNNEKKEEEEEPDTDDPEEPGITPSEAGRRSWRKYLRREGESLVTDLFLGQFRSTLKCSVCDRESVTFEPFLFVSVPIPKSTDRGAEIDIKDCLDKYVQEETLDGDEKPTCEGCKARTKCTKWYTIERWPKLLVVHLKRFAPGERFRSKLSSLVSCPATGLDLSSYGRNRFADVRYDLYGVSNHSGTLYGGHYTASCRHPYKHHLWHTYNDRMVSGAGRDRVISYEAYLLFFEKQELLSRQMEKDEEESKVMSAPAAVNGDANGNHQEVEEEEEEEEEDGDGEEEW